MAEETKAREIKSKHTAVASNLTLGAFLTTLFFWAFPNVPEEFRVYVPVAIVGALVWIGSTARDFLHSWKTDPDLKVRWWVPTLVRLLG